MTNDGILDVCGSLTVTSASTFNLSSGGTIKVEPGGSLTINTNVTLNNTGQIVNRGSLIINGDLSMTNVNATVWNLGSATSFTIGTGHLMKIGAGYFINSAAYSNVTIPTLQITGGFMCLGDNTTVYTQTFINSTTNSVLYSGTTFPACLSVQNSAQLSGTMTSSSYIGACLASGFSYASGNASNWGSAIIKNNCIDCYVVLPLQIISLSAGIETGNVNLKWNTAGNYKVGEYFEVEKSADGINFYSIGNINAEPNISLYGLSDSRIPVQECFYRIKQVEPRGIFTYSGIVMVKNEIKRSLRIFPNPVKQGNNVTVNLYIERPGIGIISLIDLSGKVIYLKNIVATEGTSAITIDLNCVKPGTYICKFDLKDKKFEYGKIVIVPF